MGEWLSKGLSEVRYASVMICLCHRVIFSALLFRRFSASFRNNLMRKGVVIILLAAVTAATWAQSGKEAKSETLLRWHFVGTKHLASLKDLKTMNEVLALPETRALQEAAAQGLAGRAAGSAFAR